MNYSMDTRVATEARSNGISRRSVAQGIAWTAPAIMMAQSAPALAASRTPVCGSTDAPWRYITYGTTSTSLSSVSYDVTTEANPGSISAGKPNEGATCNTPENTSQTTTNIGAWPLTIAQSSGSYGKVKYRTNGMCNPGDWDVFTYTRKYDEVERKWEWPSLSQVFSTTGNTTTMLMLGQNARTYTRGANGAVNGGFVSYYTYENSGSQTMYNLTMFITDVDAQGTLDGKSGYWDAVWLDGGAQPSKVSLPPEMQGSGTIADPWRAKGQPTTDTPLTSDAGTMRLDFAQLAPGQSIVLRYGSSKSGSKSTGNWQYIGISPIRYTTVPCL